MAVSFKMTNEMKTAFRLVLISLALIFLSKHAVLCRGDASGETESTITASARTQVILLGTGTPIPDPDRSGPSVAIVVNDTPYIVDFGAGVMRRAEAAYRDGIKGLAPSKLTKAFVTHLHSDHTVGYPDLIFTPWVADRTEPLVVYGPKGIRAMTWHIMQAYREDIHMRLNGLEQANRTGYKVEAHEIKPGIIYRDQNVTVTAFLVKHGSWHEAYGYRFETPDKTIVISGDTAPAESVVENCNGCDVLIHEVYSQAGFLKKSAKWQRYHSHFHTSSLELAQIAIRAKPKLLILYHQLFWNEPEADLLKEIRRVYNGRVFSGHDLDVY
jgi:ribonuclease BN (tRNA processing enzyme)